MINARPEEGLNLKSEHIGQCHGEPTPGMKLWFTNKHGKVLLKRKEILIANINLGPCTNTKKNTTQ